MRFINYLIFCFTFIFLLNIVFAQDESLTCQYKELVETEKFIQVLYDAQGNSYQDPIEIKNIVGAQERVSFDLENKIPFIDVGMGIVNSEGLLAGTLRLTVCTPSFDSAKNRLDFADENNDEYSTNIQIADMNALNASLAVIKWKKLHGFYHDNNKEHHVVYAIPPNFITNEYVNESEI